MTPKRRIVAVDIGGTHARFAIASIAGGRVADLGAPTTLRTADYAAFESAWSAFAALHGEQMPAEASIAVAGPVGGAILKFTNNPWVIRPAELPSRLGLDRVTVINDFGAVGHAVAQAPADQLVHLCGPDVALPDPGVTSIVGPGTGLGVAALVRTGDGYDVIETEGSHADFAPLDAIEDAILARLRSRHRRVSVERVVSGLGLAAIYETLAGIEGRSVSASIDDKALWAAALEGSDALAVAAMDRFCLSLGSYAGDAALIQGAAGVVIAGGIGLRLRNHLPRSGFGTRFEAKGRFESRMASMPVKLIVHPEPGLLGAAAAHASRHPNAAPVLA